MLRLGPLCARLSGVYTLESTSASHSEAASVVGEGNAVASSSSSSSSSPPQQLPGSFRIDLEFKTTVFSLGPLTLSEKV